MPACAVLLADFAEPLHPVLNVVELRVDGEFQPSKAGVRLDLAYRRSEDFGDKLLVLLPGD